MSKGNANCLSGYRLLTIVLICELVMKPRLLDLIKEVGYLSENQQDFRKGRSTIGTVENAIETFRNTQSYYHKARLIVLLVVLDVKNTFDSARSICHTEC